MPHRLIFIEKGVGGGDDAGKNTTHGRNTTILTEDGMRVEKKLTPHELHVYEVLAPYVLELLRGKPPIHIPFLFRKEFAGISSLISLPAFPQHQHSFTESYGAGTPGYEPYIFPTILQAFESIRQCIPSSLFPESLDDDRDEYFLPRIQHAYADIPNNVLEDLTEDSFQALMQKTSPALTLPRLSAHRDAHHQNWNVVTIRNEHHVQLIDLETFGLARPGWDEARIYSRFCLSEQKQDSFLDAFHAAEHLKDHQIHLYFWRCVAYKTLKGLHHLYGQHHAKKLNMLSDTQQIVEEVTRGRLRTLHRAKKEIQLLQ
ncbi:MAG: hypothetical protein HZA34_03275 [Candidatus Pacebacteria bacterium]|nr:hypothetical protein [Candidatus Paceibacterota bacterium]